jgi:hypothetical protein
MKTFIWIALILGLSMGCNNEPAQTEKSADSPYNAITDTSKVTKDSLAIPDSSARNLTH